MTFDCFRGKKIAVIGIGVSNKPLVRLLENAEADITLYDKNTPPTEFAHLPAHSGENYLDNLSADIIFRSPGVKPFEPQIVKAVENGAVLTSEIELFIENSPCEIFGVTGSDGKTTTTTILGKMLTAMGRTTHVGGNIGTPLLDKLDDIKPEDAAVLELSSFQLMTMKKSPRTAVITNVSPNHLDWHRSMKEYISAKTNVFKYSSERIILNYENNICRELECDNPVFFGRNEACQILIRDGGIYVGEQKVLDTNDILLPGEHNIENFAAAIAACLPAPEAAKTVANTFGGVEHRLELVTELDGVKYYNDSIASSPTRTLAGLRVFDKKVILIAGGRPKVGFEPLAEAAEKHIKTALLVGEASGSIRAALEGKTKLIDCGDIVSAVKTAYEIAKSGDIVLLSPACTSFDQFRNFEDRGNLFKKCVNSLPGKKDGTVLFGLDSVRGFSVTYDNDIQGDNHVG
ncbi:MAG: UDP-N-acetylmuramoyl-L-alanine--D-glutamate ligase [Oscillospiraceae bacterium]|nr:UDP-N-acetylmuramoyl-L-alanine--D-glutamate ligase [Oscillospiraceae bacterium]